MKDLVDRCLKENKEERPTINEILRMQFLHKEKIMLVVVGSCCGKTSMIESFTKNQFPQKTDMTILDLNELDFNYSGNEIGLGIWDTSGADDLSKLRPLAYSNCNCFIVCFSLVDISSLKVINQWVNEITKFGPNCPRILVGLKADLRDEF